MKKSTLYIKASVNLLIYIFGILLAIFLLPKVIVFFMPFVIGLIVSAIASPMARFIERKIKFKKKASSAMVIVLLIAIIIAAGYGILVFLFNQGAGLVKSLPKYWDSFSKTFDNIGKSFNKTFANLPADLRQPLNNLGNTFETALENFITNIGSNSDSSSIADSISSGIGSAANFLIGIIMAVLSAYFFTVEHTELAGSMEKWLPTTAYSKMQAAYRGLKNAVGGYFKAQLQIEMWVYIITVIGLIICRVDYAVIIALGIAFMDFLPFFGAGIIMVPWGIIDIVNGDYLLAVGMFVTWGVGQLVRQLIQPKIVGDNVGVAPLPTLVLLFLGYKFMNVFGMVIAIPIAMIVISLYKEGLFVNLIRSIRILWDGISSLRRLPESVETDTIEKNEETK